MDLDKILERVEPYDHSAYTKETLFNRLQEFPRFEEDLKLQLASAQNADWLAKAMEGEVYFIINDTRWKNKVNYLLPCVSLSFVGSDAVPTISLNLNSISPKIELYPRK